MESFLVKSQWFGGDEVAIADFSYLANVATIKVIQCFNHKTSTLAKKIDRLH